MVDWKLWVIEFRVFVLLSCELWVIEFRVFVCVKLWGFVFVKIALGEKMSRCVVSRYQNSECVNTSNTSTRRKVGR